MNPLRSWRAVPLPIRAIGAGMAVIGAGTIPWSALVAVNVKLLPALPWSVAVMAVYLWLLGRFLNGWGWPGELSEARRRAFRIARPRADLSPWLLFTPLYVLVSIVLGILAWRTNSTLAGMIWHALFDAAGLLRYWWGGIPKSIWEVGPDLAFRVECALSVLFAAPALWA